MKLAAGEVAGSEAEKLLAHAAACSNCAEALSRSLSALDGNPSAEEAAAIEELALARMEWQRGLARMLAATPARKKPAMSRSSRWLGGTGIAATLLLAAGLFVWQKKTNTPDHQLAMAYEQARTLELRIPEASFAPMATGAQTRGALADREPAQLLDARARLARELERSPQNERWLELQARADVLEERYNSATDVLDRLLAEGPVTAELLTDAAAAYYQRGLVAGSELDRSTALDFLRRADEMAPTDPVILFNEAIVMEDRGQMINAVEVWNRYITVERDPKWAAEGKRKLAALEQTLNRLRSHASRINRMLGTPRAMDALSGDPPKLASFDEELATYELDKLFPIAYPVSGAFVREPGIASSQQARGSPCADACLAARRLLKAIGASLELQHHDSWLTDLLSPDIDSLSAATANRYAQALQLVGQSARENASGSPPAAGHMASDAREHFQQLIANSSEDPSVATAARAGEIRASYEYMVALQEQLKFQECRAFAPQFNAELRAKPGNHSYSWIEAVEMSVEKVCDDTPETRAEGLSRLKEALRIAETDNYGLLKARVHARLAGDAQDAGDNETAERLAMESLRALYAGDPPVFRVSMAFSDLDYIEENSPRAYMAVLCLRESLGWLTETGNHFLLSVKRMELARAEMRIGAMTEAKSQLDLALKERSEAGLGAGDDRLYTEPETFLSISLLEQGDVLDAEHYLSQIDAHITGYSDSWGLRAYSAADGQLELARGNLDVAARTLETEIRRSEGRNVREGDRTSAAEFAQQDHDLYAELAATWLGQGRPPDAVLALWERFRLRSRGLPITQCPGLALDCDRPRVMAARRGLESDVLIGQVVLLDRVLVYRVDKDGVTWSQKPLRRRDVLDAAQTFERAVSSPYTSLETASRMSGSLTDALLPELPLNLAGNPSLLLEPDPMLQNLSWPVLQTPGGPLGLQFPLVELRSIVTDGGDRGRDRQCRGDRALVVGASVAAGDAPPLPEALQEARNVNRYLRTPYLLLGEQANASQVAQRLGSATIFHFAGHAVQTRDGTELLLAASSPREASAWVDGTFLRLHPPRACRLAVLSACATGSREPSWNHPLQDIVETLRSLGVPEVVATRWQIDSQASVPFMDAFYESLAKGNSAAVALTSARRVQFGQSPYSNPYYWGAYYVTGRENAQSIGELHASF